MGPDPDASSEDQPASIQSIAVISFERHQEVGERIADTLAADYAEVEQRRYDDDIFAVAAAEYDGIVATMATGIVVRKIAPLLGSKWRDPAVVAVDAEGTWAIPLVGGHHGANAIARSLADIGAVPAVTTASEVAGQRSVEHRAAALDASIETPDSTVATNLAILDEELGPVTRIDGPDAVLVSDDVTVLTRTRPDGIVLGTGCVSGVDAEQVLRAWETALAAVDRELGDVEFVATGTIKAEEEGLREAAKARDLGVVLFERDTLSAFDGPSDSRADELIGWPGIAEASALAGGKRHELLLEKRSYGGGVTVAVGR